MKFNPAHVGTKKFKPGTALDDIGLCRAIIGILLLRNGGKNVVITQADLDGLVGLCVMEGIDPATHNLLIGLGRVKKEPQ